MDLVDLTFAARTSRSTGGNRASRTGMATLLGLLSLTASLGARAEDGPTLYAHRCAGCHQADGSGVDGHFPPLKGLESWLALPAGRTYLIETLLYGPYGTVQVGGKSYDGGMPSQGQRMSDDEEVAVLRYMAEKFNTLPAGYKPFDPAEVAALRKTPAVEAGMPAERAKLPAR